MKFKRLIAGILAVALSRKIYRHLFLKKIDVTVDITSKQCYIDANR